MRAGPYTTRICIARKIYVGERAVSVGREGPLFLGKDLVFLLSFWNVNKFLHEEKYNVISSLIIQECPQGLEG